MCYDHPPNLRRHTLIPMAQGSTNELDLCCALLVVTIICCNLSIYLLHMQGYQAKLLITSLSSYLLLRFTQVNFVNTFKKIVQGLLPSVIQTFGATGSPFACMSNSLNKPVPLKLDLSLPSLQDVRWSFARLMYLFNMQLERNVAT